MKIGLFYKLYNKKIYWPGLIHISMPMANIYSVLRLLPVCSGVLICSADSTNRKNTEVYNVLHLR